SSLASASCDKHPGHLKGADFRLVFLRKTRFARLSRSSRRTRSVTRFSERQKPTPTIARSARRPLGSGVEIMGDEDKFVKSVAFEVRARVRCSNVPSCRR